jgi:hypothetical protein
MWYPDDFPPQSRTAVAAEKFRAATEFEEIRDGPRRLEPSFDLGVELRRYILRQFGVFVREACKLGKKGIWTVDDVEDAALEFLRAATSEARSSKGHDKYGREFGQSWINNWGYISPEVQRQFERSDEWRQFQAALLEVAEEQEVRSPQVDEKIADHHPSDQSQLVEAFLIRCNKESGSGSKVTRKHIWRAVGHTSSRQFYYWQKSDQKTTEEDRRNFSRILAMEPANFIALLSSRRILD